MHKTRLMLSAFDLLDNIPQRHEFCNHVLKLSNTSTTKRSILSSDAYKLLHKMQYNLGRVRFTIFGVEPADSLRRASDRAAATQDDTVDVEGDAERRPRRRRPGVGQAAGGIRRCAAAALPAAPPATSPTRGPAPRGSPSFRRLLSSLLHCSLPFASGEREAQVQANSAAASASQRRRGVHECACGASSRLSLPPSLTCGPRPSRGGNPHPHSRALSPPNLLRGSSSRRGHSRRTTPRPLEDPRSFHPSLPPWLRARRSPYRTRPPPARDRLRRRASSARGARAPPSSTRAASASPLRRWPPPSPRPSVSLPAPLLLPPLACMVLNR